jgi:hypothetical protein
MEKTHAGALLKVIRDTVCWRNDVDIAVPAGEILLSISENATVIANKYFAFNVIHNRHGLLWCLALDVVDITNSPKTQFQSMEAR